MENLYALMFVQIGQDMILCRSQTMIRIVCDSTCDLSPELIERYHIDILPLYIIMGNQEYQDGVDITPEAIYRWSDANKETPRTAAISLEATEKLLGDYTAQGDDIICFSISETMSSTGNVFRLAARNLHAEKHIHVFNSENLSTGIGLQAMEAAEMAEQGWPVDRIVEYLQALRPRVRTSFVVDTLTYLRRGGRCSSAAALLGSTLRLHPMIAVESGIMRAVKKYRGKLSTVIMKYVQDLEPELRRALPNRAFITHSGCSREIVDQVKAYMEGLGYFSDIHVTRAGCTVSSHCGPGTLGVLFVAGE